MKIIAIIALVGLAAATIPPTYPPATDCSVCDGPALAWSADGAPPVVGPRHDGPTSLCSGASGSTLLPGFLHNTVTFSTTLPPGGFTGSQLSLAFDNNLISCSLNGNTIPGTENQPSGFCVHVNNCFFVDIPDHFWDITNTLECTVEDQGGLAFFDGRLCGSTPGPLNPLDPECRQATLEEDGLLHLIPRNAAGDMGCLTDLECQTHTSSASYCKPDGTCQGCNDWEGCCDLGEEPMPPVFCNDDDLCKLEVGECSYCVNGYACFECEDDTPVDEGLNIACGSAADPDQACKDFYGDHSYCQNGVTCKQ